MTDDAELPDEKGPERTCIVTRRTGTPEALIRFVVGPDEAVVPDLRGRLPGRGAWVSGDAATLALAIKRKVFPRAFKRPVNVDAALVEQVDALMLREALQGLALANKAGRVVCGSTKVESALGTGTVAALLHARSAAPDGTRKIEAAARRLAGPDEAPAPVIQIFESHQMDLALGRSNVIHAALLIGGVSDACLWRAARLSRFRGAGLREKTATMGEVLPDDAGIDAGI